MSYGHKHVWWGHSDLWPLKSNQCILESRWTFNANLKKLPRGVLQILHLRERYRRTGCWRRRATKGDRSSFLKNDRWELRRKIPALFTFWAQHTRSIAAWSGLVCRTVGFGKLRTLPCKASHTLPWKGFQALLDNPMWIFVWNKLTPTDCGNFHQNCLISLQKKNRCHQNHLKDMGRKSTL